MPAADASERVAAILASLTHGGIEGEAGRILLHQRNDVRLSRAGQISSWGMAYARDGRIVAA